MTVSLLVLAALAAVNAPRARGALPEEDGATIAAVGALAALVALVPIAAVAGPLTDWLRVPSSTARMGVGVVLAVVGLADVLVTPDPAPEPRLPGRRAALVPIAFPVLLDPGLGFLVLAGSLDHGVAVAVAGAAVGLVTLPLSALLLPPARSAVAQRVQRALAAVVAAGLVAAGIALLIDGMFDL
jgi:small neutral amino acid transporter SnatA (MarC family)